MAISRIIIISIMVSILLSALNLVSIRDADRKQQRLARTLDLMRLGEIVRHDIDIDNLSDLEKAIAIRHYLFQYEPGRNWEGLDPNNLAGAWQKITRREAQALSSWVSLVYVAALESQGIPARYVGLFDKNTLPYRGKASVEVFIDGKWIISDPGLNVMLTDGKGNYLSWAEMREGVEYEATANGLPVSPLYENYYAKMHEFKYMIIGQPPIQLLPENWNGHIDDTDVRINNEAYFFLSEGPFR